MILNRRGFLKLMSAVGLATTLQPINLNPYKTECVTVDELDEPVTVDNPLAYLVINGMEIPVIGMSIEYNASHDWYPSDTGVKIYFPVCKYYTISFRTDFEHYQKINTSVGEKLSFIVRPKYSNFYLSGSAYITGESMGAETNGNIYCDITIISDGIVEIKEK